MEVMGNESMKGTEECVKMDGSQGMGTDHRSQQEEGPDGPLITPSNFIDT